MPNYTFENRETGEETIVELMMDELDQFKTDNPHLMQILTSTATVDPILLGVTKPPSDFQKHVLGNIKKGSGKDCTIGTGRWDV